MRSTRRRLGLTPCVRPFLGKNPLTKRLLTATALFAWRGVDRSGGDAKRPTHDDLPGQQFGHVRRLIKAGSGASGHSVLLSMIWRASFPAHMRRASSWPNALADRELLSWFCLQTRFRQILE